MENAATSNAILNIHFVQRPGATEFEVDRSELISDDMRHRITCTCVDKRVGSVFCDDFAEFIQGLLEKQSTRMMVFTDSSLVFATNNMRLGNVQILATMSGESEQKVTIRFTQVEGKVQDAFRNTQSAARTEPRKIAIEALERVVGRTYDAARVSAMVPGQDERERLFGSSSQQIIENRQDLLFRLNLLRLAVDEGWGVHPNADDMQKPMLRVV